MEWDSGDWEAGISSYIYCSNDEVPFIDEDDGEKYFGECEFSEKDLPPDKDTGWLAHGADFDILLWFSVIQDDKEREFGGSEEKWLEFVRQEISKIGVTEGCSKLSQ